jgi:cephalosporin hydroxylase
MDGKRMNSAVREFQREREQNIERLGHNTRLEDLSRQWLREAAACKYSYNFTWLGRPVIQYPQDIVALQEILWQVKPRLVIETGVAHGGSLIFYASMLELIGDGEVLGIDVDIRAHNREAIQAHPLHKRIGMIEGSSVSEQVVHAARGLADRNKPVLAVLDSNHSHEHVLREMQLYAPMVTRGSYMVVFDTVIEDMPAGSYPGRDWDKGNNPRTAVREFLKGTDRFEVDRSVDAKLSITAAAGGYLKCVKD